MPPIILIILDGWGVGTGDKGDAIASAQTPFINKIEKSYSFMLLNAAGLSVGLPWGEAGNSEVGHMAIGTGRITYQYLPRIISAIQDGTFFQNPQLLAAAAHVKKNNSRLHIMGLTSSGTVHSYVDHLYAILEFAKREKISQVFLHAFTDGKDSLPHEAKIFLLNLRERMTKLNLGRIVTIMGRDLAMDRDGEWEKTEIAYRTLTENKTPPSSDLIETLTRYYSQGNNDQNMPPAVLNTAENTRIGANDAVIFFNFREDSARQLTKAFVQEKFIGFSRKKLENLYFAAMTRYEDNLPIEIMFEPPDIANCLCQVLSQNQKKQLKIAETEKYAHVTYFFNGFKERAFRNEIRLIIPSLPISHYDQSPEMKTMEITDQIIQAIQQNDYDFILANFANADMVGHSGNLKATIKAVEFIDAMLNKIYDALLPKNGVMIITGDHGNAEEMIHPISGEIKTEHTANPVPFYLITERTKIIQEENRIKSIKKEAGGFLSDVAPTILDIMNIEKPKEMTGKSLLENLIPRP